MPDRLVVLEKADSICTITINRPEKQNTLCPEMFPEMIDAFKSVNADPSVRVVVLTGAGEKVFCAGYDLSALSVAVQDYSDKMARGESFSPAEDLMGAALDTMSECRCPVLAMISGSCIGAGLELAMGCDLRIAAQGARFATPAVRRGLIYSPDGIRRLLNLVGVSAAAELLLTAEVIDSSKAREIGLVNRVVDVREIREVTYSMARVIALNGPLGLAATKKTIAKYVRAGRLTADDEEEVRQLAIQCINSGDFQEGIQAFLEKRQPQFGWN